MRPVPPLEQRFGLARAHSTVLVAALVAAHAASARSGFRAVDVRFFWDLFANWLECDVQRSGEPLDLTQVRRLVARLVALGLVKTTSAGVASRRRGARYTLKAKGLSSLVAVLSEAVDSRPFEEAIFVVTLAACYGPLLARSVSKNESSRLLAALDPARLVARARSRATQVLRDVESRITSSEALVRDAAAIGSRKATEQQMARTLERLGAYQFQHVRSFADLVMSLPPDLRAFELGQAIELRSTLLFETFADYVRGQLAALDALAARLGRSNRAK